MKYVRDEANNLYEALDKEEQLAEITSAVNVEKARAMAAEEAKQEALNGKVDKVAGMGLSSNDFTDHHKEIVETIESGNVTGIKGNEESTYRTGNVNITPENLGATKETEHIKTRQMLATIETSATASQAYTVGSYLVLNGVLRKVTSAIAQGDTINNNNTAETNAGNELKQLNSDLSVMKSNTFETQITIASNQTHTAHRDGYIQVRSNTSTSNTFIVVNDITLARTSTPNEVLSVYIRKGMVFTCGFSGDASAYFVPIAE